jgi:hypothetical protein
LTFFQAKRQDAASLFDVSPAMWKQNFMFRWNEAAPLPQTEQELFHETDPAMDSAGLKLEKFLSVWLQGDGEDGKPETYTTIYVRSATLDVEKRAGFLQPIQGRSHQIKQVLTPAQKQFLKDWLIKTSATAWEASDDSFKTLFEP